MVCWHDNILQEDVTGLLFSTLFPRQKKVEDAISSQKTPNVPFLFAE